MEVLTAVVGKLAEKATDYTVTLIASQVGYLFNYKSKCDGLKAQLGKLRDAREQVQQRIDEAKRNGDDILDRVESWLTEVNGKISAADKLVEDEEKAKKRCLFGLCPNFKSRYKFSKKAVKEANSITELLGKGLFERVSCRPTPEGMPPVKGYEEFESRRGAFVGVMDALKDANLSIIGVYGMGGVGKTTLVEQVATQAQAMEEKLFDKVVMVPIKQTPNLLNVQDEIAEKLGMKLDEKAMDVRAGRLRKRLKEEKSVLIILDDIWSPLNLDELGVPSGDQHMGCKILMTSRNLNTLQQMGSDKNLAIEILTEEEAWNLFKNKAGDIVERRKVQPTAVKIAKKCGGLPIAVVTLAKALKHKEELFHWKNALTKLSKPCKNFKDIPPDVYSAIKLSYAFLEEEVQKTFLLCSLMGHNAAIEDLLIYCRGYGLFCDLDTIQNVRDRVLTLVSDLKDSSLLLSSSTPGCFDMHDVVRDVAVSIASMDHHWLSLEKVEVSEELSNEDRMKDCNLISFQDAQVSGLPDELECPNLSFLSMGMSGVNRTFFWFHDGRYSLEIPNNFLKGMQKLKALSFAEVQFSSLPFATDFHLLKTLRTLYLFSCKLDDISIIGELMNLEILNLLESRFKMLPREIVQLRKLKLLDLSGCRDLEVIPPNVLSGLSRLEELYLYDSFDSWEVVDEGRECPAGSKASLVELENLSHLATLEVHVRNVKAMPKDTTFFGKLERYKISVGPDEWYPWEYKPETSRMLKLSDGGDKMIDDVLLRKVQNLSLDGVEDVMNLERISYRELKAESFNQLRVLVVSKCGRLNNLFSFSIAREFHQVEEIEVSDCQNITELIAKTKEEETLKFDKLNSLKLSNLPKLVRLCGVENNLSSFKQGSDQSIDLGSNAPGLFDHKVVFSAIKELKVTKCHKLKHLFPSSIVKSFGQLKTLVVWDCDELEQVIILSEGLAEEGRNNIMVFPALDYLKLEKLPNLKRFCSGNQIEFHSLRKLEMRNCPVLSTFSEVQENNVSMENRHAYVSQYLFNEKVVFPAIKELEVTECHKLKYLFPSSIVKSFVQLKTLDVSNCDELEQVIILSDGLVEQEKLWHDGVPQIASFGLSLTTLKVTKCRKLKYLFPSSIVKSFVQLETLDVSNCDELEQVIILSEGLVKEERNNIMVFSALDCLKLRDLPCLKRFCFRNQIEFHSLREIEIGNCPVLSTFSEVQKNNSMENCHAHVPQYLFNEKVALSMLEILTIWDVENLERLWPNQLADEDSFARLTKLRVESCHKLLNVFPLSMSRRLQRLKKLRLIDCKLVEEIFEPPLSVQAQARTIVKFELPQLTKLDLVNLPNLKSFYHQLHTVNLQSLKELKVFGCDRLEILFASSFPAKTDEEKQREISIQLPLFCLNELSLQGLEELTLGWNDGMKEIWHDPQLLAFQYFCSLKVVRIESFPREMDIFPSNLFQFSTSLPNLQHLEIQNGNFKQMWEEMQEKEAPFQNLRKLEVQKCPNLKHNLVSSSVSFQNLVTLQVTFCGGIKKLVTHSTAKSLVQLQEIIISGCLEIEEIIEGRGDDEDGEVNDEIHFRQLELLELKNLPKLESFCSSRNYTFQFPSLQTVNVIKCPSMKLFSQGDSYTPMLCKVKLTYWQDEERWSSGSLNSTIQEMFKKKAKSWRIPHIIDSSDLEALRLPDAITAGKVVRLLYTNSGIGLLALYSNAVHMLWKWQLSESNPLRKATAYVAPQLWQPSNGTLMTNDISDTKPAEESAACIVLSKNDSYVISASGGKVSLFNMMTFKLMMTFTLPPRAATFLALYPLDNNIFAIGMEDSTIQIYNARLDEVKARLRGHQHRITGLAFSQTLNILVSSGADAQLCVWSMDGWVKKKSRFIHAPAGRQSPLAGETKVQFHYDQGHLLVVHESQIAIYDSELECLRSWAPKDSLGAPISSATYSCDGSLIYACFLDGAIAVFDSENLRLRCQIAPSAYIPSSSVSSSSLNAFAVAIAAHPSEPNQIALGMSDGAVHVVEVWKPSDEELKWGTTPSQDSGSLASTSSNPSLSGQPTELPSE